MFNLALTQIQYLSHFLKKIRLLTLQKGSEQYLIYVRYWWRLHKND